MVAAVTLLWMATLSSYSYAFSVAVHSISTRSSLSWGSNESKAKTSLERSMMVRNIDLPEALIFYGADIVVQRDGAGGTDSDRASSLTFQRGVQELLKECREIEAAAIVIVEKNQNQEDLETFSETNGLFHIHKATQDAPNPRDVWEAIHNDAVEIQPKGFGGSAGFGRKLADPVRSPLPQHTVVLCSNEQQCRAAIYAGMRVISLNDNDISDAVVDSLDEISLDDIATPGSFWLNPPHARDFQNNAVDPLEVMLQYEREAVNDLQDEGSVQSLDSNDTVAVEDMPDDELARILADMDPSF
jgi:hypothetical protein